MTNDDAESFVFTPEEINVLLFSKDSRFNRFLNESESDVEKDYVETGYVDTLPLHEFERVSRAFFKMTSESGMCLEIKGSAGVYFICGVHYYEEAFYLNPKEAIEKIKAEFATYQETLLEERQIKPFELLDRKQMAQLLNARDILAKKRNEVVEKEKKRAKELEKEREESKRRYEEEERNLPRITLKGRVYDVSKVPKGFPFVTNGRHDPEDGNNIFSLAKGMYEAHKEMTQEERKYGVPNEGNRLKYAYKEVGLHLAKFSSNLSRIPVRKLTQGEFDLIVEMIVNTFESIFVYKDNPLGKNEISTMAAGEKNAERELALSFLFTSWLYQSSHSSYIYVDIAFTTAWWLWSLTPFGADSRTWFKEERFLPQLRKLEQKDFDAIYSNKFKCE